MAGNTTVQKALIKPLSDLSNCAPWVAYEEEEELDLHLHEGICFDDLHRHVNPSNRSGTGTNK
jgi:hypothetical protein